jgi:hypothetical protein
MLLEIGVGCESIEPQHAGKFAMSELSPAEELQGVGLFHVGVEIGRLAAQLLFYLGGQVESYL